MKMVARDSLKMHSDADDTKTRLKNVRYINKNESVMCICHVEENSTGSDDQRSNSTETDSENDERNKLETVDHNKTKPKRKSVTFKFTVEKDNSFTDSLSIVSEPPFSQVKHKVNHRDDFALPPIKSLDTLPERRPQKKVDQWIDKTRKTGAVPERMFETLNTLGLSPRITRKMSMETLSDIQRAIDNSREPLTKFTKTESPRSRTKTHSKKIDRSLANLDPIIERRKGKLLPRRLAPVHAYPKLPTVTSNFVASNSEMEKLNFIKQALSPVPVTPLDRLRERAATISGGEKRSWIIHRRNSQDHIGKAWINSMPKELLEKAEKEVGGEDKDQNIFLGCSDETKRDFHFDFTKL